MPGPAPAVARTRNAVRDALRSLDAQPDRLVLAAVSGGADSLALAAALAFVAPREGLRAGAVVVDHGLQEGSSAVADHAAAQCRTLGLAPVEVASARVEEHGDGPEAAARRARYAALDAVRTRCAATHLLVAHTRDDQAEQVLLGLLRGSGARSLAGMAPVAGTVLRPFLELSRSETESACTASGLEFWRDPHNDDTRYSRVRARRHLAALSAQLGESVLVNLARTARLLRDDDTALETWARTVVDAAPTEPGGVGRSVEVAQLSSLPRAVRTRVLRLLVLEAGADGAALGFGHLDQLDRLVTDWRGQGPIDVPGRLQVERRRGSLAIGPRRPVE